MSSNQPKVFRAKAHQVTRLITFSLLLMCSAYSQSQSQSSEVTSSSDVPATANDTIAYVTDSLLAELPVLSAGFDDSPESFYQGIDRLVSPWIDYESFYKGVMGREHYTLW